MPSVNADNEGTTAQAFSTMRASAFLSDADAHLLERTLAALADLQFSAYAITGRVALEALKISRGLPSARPPLNDLDLVVESWGAIPPSVTERFLCVHVHPEAPPGKTLVQLVDPTAPLRIDIFRSFGRTLDRVEAAKLGGVPVGLVSFEDLCCRNAALLLRLRSGTTEAVKHAVDFIALSELIDPERVQIAWQDYRAQADPETFAEAAIEISHLLRSRVDLLTTPEYLRDASVVCAKCKSTPPFIPAPPQRILDILGYC